MASRAHTIDPKAARFLALSRRRVALTRRACAPDFGGPARNVNARIMWQIDRALVALFKAGRRSIAIVDLGCGDGSLLMKAARHARALGFVAVDAKGIDARPDQIGRAAVAAAALGDPAIGLTFEVGSNTGRVGAEDEEFDIALTAPGFGGTEELARVTHRDGTLISHG